MNNSPILIIRTALLITTLTVFIQPIYVLPDTDVSGLRGFPVAWLTYQSTTNTPFIGGILDPFAMVATAQFNTAGFLIDLTFWMFILTVISQLRNIKREDT